MKLRKMNMCELCYCQYAFTWPECRIQEIGPGIDPHYQVELVREGPIAAVVSRVELDQYSPERLQGKRAKDLRWLGKIAARHTEVICQASISSPVLPLRLGTMVHSLDLLQAGLVRYEPVVASFLEQLGNRQEWDVTLYLTRRRLEPIAGHVGPPSPHYIKPPGTDQWFGGKTPPANPWHAENIDLFPSATPGAVCLAQQQTQWDNCLEQRETVFQTIQMMEQCLSVKADGCCRIPIRPRNSTGRTEEIVFNAAFLLPSTSQASWLETVHDVCRDARDKGLVVEVSGPRPPYHFCPSLEL
jgi:hypothetical protein